MKRRRVTYRPNKAQGALGVVFGVIFIAIGLFVVTPVFGPFGLLWTLMAVGITAANGYQAALEIAYGNYVEGIGGGICQVSSTLYNALLQLPGIEILQRRPHGPDGAKYLPHGVDAAVGSDVLNLRFRNDYDFPIRVEGHTSDDGALTMVIYRVDE